MAWPLSHDFNEAVQNPGTAFADPELKAGRVVTTPLGVPRPRSGNYADVYQIAAAGGPGWAVKCFTRPPLPEAAERFAAIADHLRRANLPFTVGFQYLPDGVRVKGKWHPVVKMQWVDGLPINTFVRDNLGRASLLESMLSLWVRLCRRLRETGMAHADLQHGNVLLVPAEGGKNSLGLKLVDYDGMYVPALAGKPSGELGHASYQHPDRAGGVYSADLDRFPHLVVATALRAVLVGGRPLWDRYDTGDNLLFTEKDFKAPGQSRLMRELWDAGDPFTVGLLAHLVLSCGKPIGQTPWLDVLTTGERPPPLTPSQERQAAALLGVPVAAVPDPTPPAAPPPPPVPAPPPIDFTDAPDEPPARPARPRGSRSAVVGAAAAGLLTFAAIAGGVVFVMGKGSPEVTDAGPPAVPPPADAPKPADPLPEPAKPAREVWAVAADDDPAAVADAARLAPDGGRVLVVPHGKGVVHVLDAATGKRTATFAGPKGQALHAAPLPNGQAVAVAAEPALLVWDTATGKQSARRPTARGGLTALRVDAAGRFALLVEKGKAAVVPLDGGPAAAAFDLPSDRFLAAALAPDGSRVLTATAAGTLTVAPLPAGPPDTKRLATDGVIAVAAWHPGRGLAVARRGEGGILAGEVLVIDTATGQVARTLPGPYAPPAAFTADGATLVLAAADGLEVWDTATWAKRTVPAKGAAAARDLDLTPDGRRAVVAGDDGKVRLVPLTDEPPAPPPSAVRPPVVAAPPEPPVPPGVVVEVATLTLADLTGRPARLAAVDRTGQIAYYVTPTDELRSIALASKGAGFTRPADGTPLALWPTAAGTLVVPVRTAAGSTDLHVLDGRTGRRVGQPLTVAPAGTAVEGVTVSADGTRASVTAADAVTVWDLRAGTAVHTRPGPARGPARLTSPPDRLVTHTAAGTEVLPLAGGPPAVYAPPGSAAWRLAGVADDASRVLYAADTPAGPRALLHSVGDRREVAGVPALGPAGDPLAKLAAGGRVLVSVGPMGLTATDAATGRPVGRRPLPVGRPLAVTDTPATGLVTAVGDTGVAVYRVAPDPPPPEPARTPVPDAAALAAKDAGIAETYKAEFARKAPADRRKLAEKLIREADGATTDPPFRFALLRQAAGLAADAGDPALALKAADALAETFAVDAAAERAAALERTAATGQTAAVRAAAEAALDQADALADRDEYDAAVRLAGLAAGWLAKAGPPAAHRDAEARQAEVARQRELFAPVRAAAERLKADPADPAASLAVGRHRWFVQGRWADGAPLVAAGPDPALKKLGELEAKAGTDPETTDAGRGDAWAEYAERGPEADRPAARGRSRYWYGRALAQPAERDRAADKLAFTEGKVEYRPGVLLEAYSLQVKRPRLGRIDPVVAAEAKDFRPATGTAVRLVWTGRLVAPAGGRYRLIADTADPVKLTLLPPGEDRVLFDVKSGQRKPAEGEVVLKADRPQAFTLEYFAPTAGQPPHAVSLRWVRPGQKNAEPVPPSALYWAGTDKAKVTDRSGGGT